MHLTLTWLLLGGATLCIAAEAARPPKPLRLYVSPDGSDAWSGRRAGPNAARTDGPFATIERARDAVRLLRRQQGGALRQPVMVFLRDGTYRLKAPLVFTSEDSGSAPCPVTYAAYRNEKPLVSGGRLVTGWKAVTREGRRLWVAEIPESRAGQWYFHQLWVNGQRRVRARHPNQGYLKVVEVPDLTPQTGWDQGQNRFRFAPGDLRAWQNLEDVDVVLLHLWIGERLAVASVDEAQRIVTFQAPSRSRLTEGSQPARYYVENAHELLDAPGEWYLDRKSGTLSYMPLPGEQLNHAEVVAPALPQLLRLEGQPETGKFVEHLTFRGLTFARADWWLPRTDPGGAQAAVYAPGALHADGVRDCAFEGCTVAHVSSYALELARGCQRNRVAGCDFHDLGAGGVRIGEPAIRDDAALQTHDNEVTDCQIHAGGRCFHQAVGLWIGQSFHNRIAHNAIHDLYYTGISVGWTWGYDKSLAHGNVIEQNDIYDIGQGWLSDMGGIYTLGLQPGTIIRGNCFHDVAAYAYGGWGIYFDEGSTNILAEGNQVYRTTHGGFHQHYGRDNVVRNNLFAYGRDAQIQRTRVEPHRSFTFERNIVLWRSGDLLAGDWSKLNVAFDHNLYWREGGGDIRFDDRTWEEWRAQGMDTHSVIADPHIVRSDNDDFRLRTESPGFALGFTPLDLSHVGPRKSVLSHSDKSH
jgi:glycosyl hydrolase family 141/parallel beta helix pectate lyase-like protein